MFNPRIVKEKVMKRAVIIGVKTEEQLHDLYAKVMYEELEAAKLAVLALAAHVDSSIARNPSKGWTMQTAEQRKEIRERINEVLEALRTY